MGANISYFRAITTSACQAGCSSFDTAIAAAAAATI